MIIKKPLQYANVIDRQGDCGVFDTMNDAIRLASIACEEYSKYSLSRKNDIIDAVTRELESHLEELSLMTYKETGNSSYEDILYKNTATLSSFKNNNYLEARLAADDKINNCEDSRIVNGVIVPSSNPIGVIIENSILMLKAGHAVVFSSNKNVKHVFAYAVKLISNAIETINGPKNLIVTIKEPSRENTTTMIEHEEITLLSPIDNNNEGNIAM